MKTDPPQKPEAVPKLIYTKSALILLEEQFCVTSKSLNFPSVDGTSKYRTRSPLSLSAMPGIICIHNSLPGWMQDQDLGLMERGRDKSRSGLESCFTSLHASGRVQIPSVCRASDDSHLNHYFRFQQQNDALALFSQVCSSAYEIDFLVLSVCPSYCKYCVLRKRKSNFFYWWSEWTAIHLQSICVFCTIQMLPIQPVRYLCCMSK